METDVVMPRTVGEWSTVFAQAFNSKDFEQTANLILSFGVDQRVGALRSIALFGLYLQETPVGADHERFVIQSAVLEAFHDTPPRHDQPHWQKHHLDASPLLSRKIEDLERSTIGQIARVLASVERLNRASIVSLLAELFRREDSHVLWDGTLSLLLTSTEPVILPSPRSIWAKLSPELAAHLAARMSSDSGAAMLGGGLPTTQTWPEHPEHRQLLLHAHAEQGTAAFRGSCFAQLTLMGVDVAPPEDTLAMEFAFLPFGGKTLATWPGAVALAQRTCAAIADPKQTIWIRDHILAVALREPPPARSAARAHLVDLCLASLKQQNGLTMNGIREWLFLPFWVEDQTARRRLADALEAIEGFNACLWLLEGAPLRLLIKLAGSSRSSRKVRVIATVWAVQDPLFHPNDLDLFQDPEVLAEALSLPKPCVGARHLALAAIRFLLSRGPAVPTEEDNMGLGRRSPQPLRARLLKGLYDCLGHADIVDAAYERTCETLSAELRETLGTDEKTPVLRAVTESRAIAAHLLDDPRLRTTLDQIERWLGPQSEFSQHRREADFADHYRSTRKPQSKAHAAMQALTAIEREFPRACYRWRVPTVG
jgi:hypothetical protein